MASVNIKDLEKIGSGEKLPQNTKWSMMNKFRFKTRDFYKNRNSDGILYWGKDNIIRNSLDLKGLEQTHNKEPSLIIIHTKDNIDDVKLVLKYDGLLSYHIEFIIVRANERSESGGKKIRKNRKSKKIRKNRKSKKNRKTNKRRRFSKKLK